MWITKLCPYYDGTGDPHAHLHEGWPCPYWRVACIIGGGGDPNEIVAEWSVDLSAMLDGKGRVPLSLNDRQMHWGAHAHRVEMIKSVTRNAVIAAEIPHLTHVHVELHFRPKTNAHRDKDNIVATLKPMIDGLHQRDTSENHPVDYTPIIDGDDPRYVSWTSPFLHPWVRSQPARLWMILRSYL